jgi:hypothetical protein
VTRYVAATNVVMSMDHTDEEMKLLIDKFIRVSDGTKDRVQAEWETTHVAHGMPIPACAACGSRNPHHARQYVRWKLSSLPSCFFHSPEDRARVEKLGTAEIFNFQMQPVVVDLGKLVSCFKSVTNRWFHLHPELVDVIAGEGGGEGDVISSILGMTPAQFETHEKADNTDALQAAFDQVDTTSSRHFIIKVKFSDFSEGYEATAVKLA